MQPPTAPSRPFTLFPAAPWPALPKRREQTLPAEAAGSAWRLVERAGPPVQEALATSARRWRAEFSLSAPEDGADLAVAQLEAGLDDQGRPRAWHFRLAGAGSGQDAPADDAAGAAALPYRFDARQVECSGALGAEAMRFSAFCIESACDELAAAAGADPLDFRLQHLADRRWRQTLEAAANAAGWADAPAPGSARGLAVGCCFHSVVAQVVELRRAEDGGARVERVTMALDSYLPLARQRSQSLLQMAVRRTLERQLDGALPPPRFDLVLVGAAAAGQRTLVADGVATLAAPTLLPALANALRRLGQPRRLRLAAGT
ncbi:MAG: hypothetical protein U1F50_05890 [Rubrivivax sp.]